MKMDKIFWRDAKWLDRDLDRFGKVLDVGAGGFRRGPNVTTMDVLPLPNTDVAWNCDQYPWPFPEASFDCILLGNVFEHVRDVVLLMRELHRIARPDAIIRIITPHFSSPCSFADPTHRRCVSVHILDMFTQPEGVGPGGVLLKKLLGCDIHIGSQFIKPMFHLRRRSLYFREFLWPTLVPLWGNVFQDMFETYGHRLMPAWAIYFELRALK